MGLLVRVPDGMDGQPGSLDSERNRVGRKGGCLGPDEPGGYQMLGILKKALRLNPSKTVALSWAIAEAQLVAEQYGDVIQTSRTAIARKPDAIYPHVFLADAYSALGRGDEAQREAARVL